ncbi:MAG TPA: hypothetical protein VGZ93_11565 [Candidatus Methylacidiphilales bacterium]|jgi:predicted DNA-binding protein|nr:hypothetical protein [Candidatus Methylacidiphilales bacterium]
MNPIKPLSLKIHPEVRHRLKNVAYKMEWTEHQLAKNILEAVLDMVERKDSTALDRIVHLSQAAQAFDQSAGQILPETRGDKAV